MPYRKTSNRSPLIPLMTTGLPPKPPFLRFTRLKLIRQVFWLNVILPSPFPTCVSGLSEVRPYHSSGGCGGITPPSLIELTLLHLIAYFF
jgi:hypothetical protein